MSQQKVKKGTLKAKHGGKKGKTAGKSKLGAKHGGKASKHGKHTAVAMPKKSIEIAELEQRVLIEAPTRGAIVFADKDTESHEGGPLLTTTFFQDLPISRRTLEGMKQHGFTKLTEIQKFAIPHALCGRDVCGEAKTGSGKTLAFLVPLIELLYRRQWSKTEGLGALIIAPTRELAYQIFQELKKVGCKHDFSAACCVGGRNVEDEQERLGGINILVATPGRLLQHLDESPDFDATNIQMLVVDEADRILDLGFQETMRNIMEHLSIGERQTLLFSATMRASVQQLATMALKDPQVVSVHQSSSSSTPAKLRQMYMQVPLENKVDALFSFLRAHSQKRMIVFVQTCKQVRFLYESFFKLKPGPAVMELHGKQSQEKRTCIFEEFKTKPRAVALICTDIAARGLDFPDVDWVVQMDCPDSVDSYIHRVGRTARYQASGQGLLMLAPSELAFVDALQKAKVQISSIKMKASKLTNLVNKLQALLSHSPDIRYLGERAFVSYIRSVRFMNNKEVFKVAELPREKFAASLGLAQAPEMDLEDESLGNKKKKMTKLERLKAKIKAEKEAKRLDKVKKVAKNADQVGKTRKAPDADRDDSALDGQSGDDNKKKKSKWERRQEALQAKRREAAEKPKVDEDEDDLFVKKVDNLTEPGVLRKPKKLKLRKDGTAKGTSAHHTYFDGPEPTDFNLLADVAKEAAAEESEKSETDGGREAYLEQVKQRLAATQKTDKELHRKKLREKHLTLKERTAAADPNASAALLSFSGDNSGMDDVSMTDNSEHAEQSDVEAEESDLEAKALRLLM